MRKMVLFVECGVGTKDATAYLVPASMTEEELNDYAWQAACQHADSYGHYPESERPDDCEEDEEEIYDHNIKGWFEEYDVKEHDGQLIFGGNSTFTWYEL